MTKSTLTCAHAIVKYLIAQKILINGKKEPLFPGVFGIFGHGNVACLGQALEENQKELKPILSKSLSEASTQAILQALEIGVSEEELFSIGETNTPKIRGENKSNQESLNELAELSSQGRPIPGQSLVNNPDSKYPWENPPTFANPREALDDVTTTILTPDVAKNIVQALAKGAAAIDLSMGVLYSKFLQGDISIDNLLLLAEPTTSGITASIDPI